MNRTNALEVIRPTRLPQRRQPTTTGRGWHRGATQPIPVIVPRARWTSRLLHFVRHVLDGSGFDSPAQQRALEHLAVQRLIGR